MKCSVHTMIDTWPGLPKKPQGLTVFPLGFIDDIRAWQNNVTGYLEMRSKLYSDKYNALHTKYGACTFETLSEIHLLCSWTSIWCIKSLPVWICHCFYKNSSVVELLN